MNQYIGYVHVGFIKNQNQEIEKQKKAIKDFCDTKKYEICNWIIDVDKKKDDSLFFLNYFIYSNLKKEKELSIIVSDDYVISEEVMQFFYYLYLLKKSGIKIVSLNNRFANSLCNSYYALIDYIVKKEKNDKKSKELVGRVAKANKGGYAGGRLPLGYKSVNGQLIINESEAKAVKLIFQLYDDGMPYNKIALYLNSRGVKTKRSGMWNDGTVFHIIQKRKFYQGLYKYGKNSDWVKGQHEAILKEN